MAGTLRKRTVGSRSSESKPKHEKDKHDTSRNGKSIEQSPGTERHIGLLVLSCVWWIIGLFICFFLGYKHAWFMNEIHEAQYFFTGIQVNLFVYLFLIIYLFCICLFICLFLGYKHAWFMNEIHETQYFFLGIQVNPLLYQ